MKEKLSHAGLGMRLALASLAGTFVVSCSNHEATDMRDTETPEPLKDRQTERVELVTIPVPEPTFTPGPTAAVQITEEDVPSRHSELLRFLKEEEIDAYKKLLNAELYGVADAALDDIIPNQIFFDLATLIIRATEARRTDTRVGGTESGESIVGVIGNPNHYPPCVLSGENYNTCVPLTNSRELLIRQAIELYFIEEYRGPLPDHIKIDSYHSRNDIGCPPDEAISGANFYEIRIPEIGQKVCFSLSLWPTATVAPDFESSQ